MNTQATDFQSPRPEATEPGVAKLTDAMTPGAQIDFDPAEAERAGAFQEQALSQADAEAATDDVAAVGV